MKVFTAVDERRAFRDSLGASVGFVPTMGVLDTEHGRQNIVPCLRLVHHLIWKHASVPANVAACLEYVTVLVAKPETRILGDVEFAVGIKR